MTKCCNFFSFTISTSGTIPNFLAGFGTCCYFANCPHSKSMSKRSYFTVYITVSAQFTCPCYIAAFCAGRICYYTFINVTCCRDFFSLSVITSGTVANFFSGFCTCCFAYRPCIEIMRRNYIFHFLISTYCTCILRSTILLTLYILYCLLIPFMHMITIYSICCIIICQIRFFCIILLYIRSYLFNRIWQNNSARILANISPSLFRGYFFCYNR